ncbi:MAG TPA: DMT family transporter [Alphaproteobacteria bacterium]|nr:DMT family transporter [Alphaproteobacteria bacterium]
MPALFVVMWSSGFIGAKYGLPYVEPFTFLLLRFAVVSVILALVALVAGAPWPESWGQFGHIAVAGLLVQGVYLGGIFAAIHLGVPAGVSAIIVSIQPLLTAAVAGPLLGEQIDARRWLGLALGFAGVVLVVARTLHLSGANLAGLALCVMSLVAITAGTLYQKRYCAALDLRSGSLIQFAASALLMLALSALFEQRHVEWTSQFIFALIWVSVVLSIGAISLLFTLIRRGAASQVASLFYLVPPVTALMAYVFFGETLGPLALLGMAIAAVGVALVNR